MVGSQAQVTRRPRLGLVLLTLSLWGPVGQPNAWGQPQPTTVPDPSPSITLLPGAANAGPPAWAHPGTRLVFYGGSASVPGEYKQFVLDENGKWVEKDTGKRWGEQDIPGGGGCGYSVFRIGYIDHDVVQLNCSTYLLNTLDNTVVFSGNSGLVTNASCAADLWVNPEVLKNVKEIHEGGTRIIRMPYVLNNKKFNVIRFQTTTAIGYTAYMYDLDTGLMVFHGSSAKGPAVFTAPPPGGGQAGIGSGSTFMESGWLVEVKDVDIPWKADATPAWVGKFSELSYRGVQSTAVAGGMQFDRPYTAAITPKARSRGWLRYASNLTFQSPGGLPPEQTSAELATGPASIGGLWIGPEAIAKLKADQVIDRNDITKTVTSVTYASPRAVTISEIGQLHRIDWTYDRGSGVVAEIRISTQIGVGQITHRLQLVGQK